MQFFGRRIASIMETQKMSRSVPFFRRRSVFIFATVSAISITSLSYIIKNNSAPAPTTTDNPKASYFKDWKEYRVGRYENRLRKFSHPQKVFSYFASVKKVDRESGQTLHYMTPRDFIRSLLPYRQPRSPDTRPAGSTRVQSAELFLALADTDGNGLIDYSEYILFLTLIATPEYHWKISFKLFDENGDGTITQQEFGKLMARSTADLAIGQKMGSQEHRDSTGLARLFFGKDGSKSVTYAAFSDFMSRLHLEVLKLEFNQYEVINETIDMRDFAASIVANDTTSTYQSRLASLTPITERISFAQFYAFNQMIRTRMHDLSLAYRFQHAGSKSDSGTTAGAGFNPAEFRRIVRTLTKLELGDGQVSVLFELFDSNADGHLDASEFHRVLKNRGERGLNAPRDLGIGAMLGKLFDVLSGRD